MDRNTQRRDFKALALLSLSARRAWIEILFRGCYTWIDGVALRKESVDRNTSEVSDREPLAESLSARRAWIEINCS